MKWILLGVLVLGFIIWGIVDVIVRTMNDVDQM